MFKYLPALFLSLGTALISSSALAHVNPTAPLFEPTLSVDRPAAPLPALMVLTSQANN